MIEAKKLSRRQFLSDIARLGGAASTLLVCGSSHAQSSPSPPRNLRIGTPTKAVLRPSDFSYVGAFKLPASSGGISTGWGHTLAHRYVGGQLRFFSCTSRVQGTPTCQVYEVSYPGSATSNYPTASVVRHWGNIYHGKRWNDCTNSADDGTVYGLYWDETDCRLYWNYGDGYNASAANNCCIGASTLNDNDGTSVAIAAWRMSASRGCKAAQGGMTAVPGWFATRYTSGRRLAVGFGGRGSAESVGPVSDGPALAAIDLLTFPTRATCLATQLFAGIPVQSSIVSVQMTTPIR